MCTVTYLPLKGDNFILTSNRDETPLRKTISPKTYVENGVELTYPKDDLAGGTSIGASNRSRLVCLLNGGFTKHKRKLPYKMSRGVIVKNILSVDHVLTYIDEFDFFDIEPFTLILVDWENELNTYELVWDGIEKYFSKLTKEPKIWSSSTLYDQEMKKLREDWFTSWLIENGDFSQEKIFEFHNNDNLGNLEISPKMKRNYVETVSITSVEKNNEHVFMEYYDVLEGSLKKIDLQNQN